MMRGVLTVLVLLLFIRLNAQDTIGIKLQSLPMGDSIILRWAPSDIPSWNHANAYGYQLQRAEVRKGRDLNDYKIIADHLQLWDEEKWKSSLNQKDEWEVVAASMIYGTYENPESLDQNFTPESIEDRGMEAENKFAIHFFAASHSLNAAVKLGEAYVDRQVAPGASYLYKLIPKKGNSPSLISPGLSLVSENRRLVLPTVENLSLEWGDSLANLTWDNYLTYDTYISFAVERKKKGEDSWLERNTAPIVMGTKGLNDFSISFRDSLENNDIEYAYRVIGHTPFSIKGPPSEVLSGKGKESFRIENPFIRVLEDIERNGVKIGWQFDQNMNKYLLGFNLYKSPTYDGNYLKANKEIIPAHARIYEDSSPYPSGFYYVEAVDIEHITHVSLTRLFNPKDVSPPSMVSGLTCTTDTSQHRILLNWNPSTEIDLAGYRLFSSFNSESGYQDIADSLLTDSNFQFDLNLNRNGEAIFFKAMAIDQRNNNSRLSEPCIVFFKDIRPPSPPLIRRFIQEENKISFEWAGSPSRDLVRHQIERLTEGMKWQVLNSEDETKELHYFEDTLDLKRDVDYTYRIKAIDKSGLSSYSSPKKGRIWASNIAPQIKDFEIVEREDLPYALVRWKYLPPELIDKIEIYRQRNENPPRRYKTIFPNEIAKVFAPISKRIGQYQWEDTWVNTEQVFKYSIRVILKNEMTTQQSEWVDFELGSRK